MGSHKHNCYLEVRLGKLIARLDSVNLNLTSIPQLIIIIALSAEYNISLVRSEHDIPRRLTPSVTLASHIPVGPHITQRRPSGENRRDMSTVRSTVHMYVHTVLGAERVLGIPKTYVATK